MQNEVLFYFSLRQGYDYQSISDKVMIFGLFQTNCEARGAIFWEPNNQAEVNVVGNLLNLSKHDYLA